VILRDYQREALDDLDAAIAEGKRSILVALPTGLGKTAIVGGHINRSDVQAGECVLFVAHVDELLTQAADTFAKMLPAGFVDKNYAIEKGVKRASPFSRVIIASVQTLKGPRLAEFMARFRGRIKRLVIDEAHRAASKGYRNLIDAVLADRDDAVVLGVTATPKRTDNVGLGVVFERVAYSMDIRQAIKRGYLCDIRAYRVDTSVSLDDVDVTSSGELNPEQLARAVDREVRNQRIVAAYKEIVPGRKGLVFVASVSLAKRVADLFCRAGVPAEAAWGDMPLDERRAAVQRYRDGKTRVLVNFALYLEGFDVADTEVVIHARPTKSSLVYTQATGRVTRPHPTIAGRLGEMPDDEARRALIAASPKPFAVVIDVVDVTSRHTLQSLPSLFGLPARLDALGRSITGTKDRFEELRQRDPAAAIAQVDVAGIEAKLAEVDVFSVPQLPPQVGAVASMQWAEVEQGTRYSIVIPRFSWAQREDGTTIDDYDYVLRREMNLLRRRLPNANPRPLAERDLRVVPGSRRTLEASLEVAENALGEFDCFRVENGVRTHLGVCANITIAVTRCEDYIRRKYPWGLRFLTASDQAWATKPISLKQTNELRRRGCPENRIPETSGQAHLLLNHIIARESARQDQPA
jgi:superfamily II DNA or RNA helicase